MVVMQCGYLDDILGSVRTGVQGFWLWASDTSAAKILKVQTACNCLCVNSFLIVSNFCRFHIC